MFRISLFTSIWRCFSNFLTSIRRFFSNFLFGGDALLERHTERRIALTMLGLTLCYLIFELGFNARLLDVVGGLATHEEVERIEVFGRLISGTALALLFLGFQLQKAARRNWTLGTYLQRLPLVAAICISTMYFGQRALVDWLVERSSAEDRSRAAVLVPMTHLMTQQNFSLTGLDLDAAGFRTPEGKTFLATFPLQALSVPGLSDRLTKQAPIMFAMFAEQVRGTPEDFHRDFTSSQKRLQELYEQEYLPASRRFVQETTGLALSSRQDSAWYDYRESLRRRHRRLHPGNVPPAHWPSVRQELQHKEVPVSSSWRPNDRQGFDRAVEQQVRNKALATFRLQARDALGLSRNLDPGLSKDQFLAHPAIQDKWKESLSLPQHLKLSPDPSVGALERAVYEPAIEADAERLVRERLATPALYADGARFATIGRDSYRSLIVPPIALFFSLAGAITHLFKCGAFAVKTRRRLAPRIYKLAWAVYFALAATLPLLLTNQVTHQHLFQRLADQTRDELGWPGSVVAGGIRWTTQFQPVFYPVNEFVRTKMLLGLSYGYEGDTGTPRDSTH